MMRSLFSGVAGLRTHQTKMDVIGNNIANVNTVGYKSQSATFRDLMYQTTQAASGANAETGVGGTNARQIGLGVTTGAINTNITGQGSAQTTNNAFDIMITGDAFFVVSNGMENFFTRDGSFYVDGAGNLAMTSTGYNVMGWQVDPETGDPKPDTVTALKVMDKANMNYPPAATTDARVTGIVDKNDTKVNSTSGRIINLEFYDAQGYKYTAKFSLHATGTDGQYYVALDDILDSNGKSIGEEQLGMVSFGDTLEVDTAIAYTSIGKTETVGTVTFNTAAGPAQNPGPFNINQPITLPNDAMLLEVYGISATEAAKFQSATINEKGNLIVTAKPGETGVQSSYAPQKGISAAVTVTSVNITPRAGAAAIPLGVGSFAVNTATGAITGTGTPAPTPAPTSDQIKELYGLDLSAEKVKEITINADGSLTVTKKDVDKATNLVYNTGNGEFVSVGGSGEGLITLGLSSAHEKFSDITIDFSTTTNVNNDASSTIGATKGTAAGLGAGRKVGTMIGLSIAKSGLITASYDNGMSKCVGQIATAVFANASGLEKQGDNLYSATANSGEFDGIGVDIEASGSGYMQSGVLEMSNVDLSQEFTEMITTQRGFQANSRIITVSDTMLEELTNLKR